MLNEYVFRVSGSIILFTITLIRCFSQDTVSHPVKVMFYNVENLFDVYNDTAKDDNDFLPGGVMRWNETRYHKKINSLYKTIVAAGEWNPPDIVALCEVENRKVLEDLVFGTYLSKYNYRIIHEESPDQRGIDVCIIYRTDLIRPINYSYWVPSGIRKEDFTTRSILYTRFSTGSDTIHVIVNHWPSRRGGVLAEESLRSQISSMVREKADSINRRTRGGSKIIILGDFNCTPDDKEMESLVAHSESGNIYFNLSEKMEGEGLGTYRYKGIWEMIDQIIVSEKLITCKTGLYTELKQAIVFRPDFLLIKDPAYPGLTPFSTYRGFRYQGGFSDHLPVLLNLQIRNQAPQE
jgi:endonuclease/exonuclease/phosphatase family metal-dependent hydrolase